MFYHYSNFFKSSLSLSSIGQGSKHNFLSFSLQFLLGFLISKAGKTFLPFFFHLFSCFMHFIHKILCFEEFLHKIALFFLFFQKIGFSRISIDRTCFSTDRNCVWNFDLNLPGSIGSGSIECNFRSIESLFRSIENRLESF